MKIIDNIETNGRYMHINIWKIKNLVHGDYLQDVIFKYSGQSHCAEKAIQSEKGERKESKVSDDHVYDTGRENRSAED